MASETKQEPCRECDGEGRWYDASHGSSRHCQNCGGTGFVPVRSGEARQPETATCPDCGHAWEWHGDDGNGCMARVSEDNYCRCIAQQPPASAVTEVLVSKSALNALATAVKGCHAPVGVEVSCGEVVYCPDPEPILCDPCEHKMFAAISSLLSTRETSNA